MKPKILVLAGRRSASLDPLAEAAGVTHKCLVPVRGEAMVGRVLRTAAAAFPDPELFLSGEGFDAVKGEPTVARLHAEGRLAPVEAQYHIVDSITAAAKVSGFPLIITTADNVLGIMNPGVLDTLLTNLGGQVVLVVAAALFVLGYLLMRRLSKVEL